MRWTPEDFANAIGGFRRELAGIVRRKTIGAVPGSIWQMIGHALFDATQSESSEIEVFSGIGFFARPAGGGTAEGIVVEVGGANGPAVIATRDEATRAKVDDIKADETAMFNSEARVHVMADGSVEIRTHAGVAVKIPRLQDLVNLIKVLNGAGTGAATAIPAAIALAYTALFDGYLGLGAYAGQPFGLTKLKAE